MRLFLAGGGDALQSRAVDERFVEELKRGKLLYIPVAMDPADHEYPSCEAWVRSALASLGVTDIQMVTDLTSVHDLNDYAGIYIGGGNTYRLLKQLRSSGFDKKLKKYIASGGLVYGGSAGALIMGKSIDTTHDENTEHLTDLSGLDLLHGIRIACHYVPEEKEKLTIMARTGAILAIPEEAGIQVDGNTLHVITQGAPVVVFGKLIREYENGESIEF